MLKALLKKQFLELSAFYFRDKRTGKKRSKSATFGFILIFIILFFSVGILFFGISDMIGSALIPSGLDWLYFALMGLLSIFLGTFGSVFSTFAGLYLAKDNELLLSMPIPPLKILFVRITGVYAMSFLYSALVWIPTVICYWLRKKTSVLSVVFSLLLTLLIALFVTVLGCVLGWVVASILSKIKKHKSLITVILTLLFICVYYFIYFRINSILQSLILNIESIGSKIKAWAYPIYQMGNAAAGEIWPMIFFTAFVALLFAAVCFILLKSFSKIVTANRGIKKAVYKERKVAVSKVSKALLRKELKRFTASPIYMLNTGLGALIMPALAIAAVIKRDSLKEIIGLFGALPGLSSAIPLIVVAAICLICSLDSVTSPSVSLEGKSIWILQAMPVRSWDVLRAKERLHLLLNLLPAVLSTVVIGIVIDTDIVTILCMVACVCLFIGLSAAFGLAMNLKKPNLDWTNEIVPVKQGMSVLFSLLGGWFLIIALGGLYYLLRNVLNANLYLLICSALFIFAILVLQHWLKTKGSKIFETL